MASPSNPSMTPAPQKISYPDLQRIVWSFADLIRDKGEGTTEDYARVTIPTLALKRILDVKDEFMAPAMLSNKKMIDDGLLDIDGVLRKVNAKHYKFFDSAQLHQEGKQSPTIMLLSWGHVLAFQDNPNRSPQSIDVGYGQSYVTSAGNFVELFAEVIKALSPNLRWVFEAFNYQNLILSNKPILPYDEFHKICHSTANDGLNRYVFNTATIDGDIFGDVYMDLIGRFAHDSGKKGGEFFTPSLLTAGAIRFLKMEKLADAVVSGLKKRILVGDPTSGSNTFLIKFHQMLTERVKAKGGVLQKDSVHFYTQELKQFQASLGVLNMVFHELSDVHNMDIPLEHQVSNVITNYKNGIGKKAGMLDIVLANPPYGLKDYGEAYAKANTTSDARFAVEVPKKSDGELAFLMTITDLLNANGQAVVVMPMGTLFRDSGAKIREQWLREDVIEGIVTLPNNMFLTTQIPVCLWILNKNKSPEDKNKIFMVNAENDFVKVGKFNEWQQDKSVEAYHKRVTVDGYCGYAEAEAIIKNNFNLSVSRYFSPEKVTVAVDLQAVTQNIAELEKEIAEGAKWMNNIFAQIPTASTAKKVKP